MVQSFVWSWNRAPWESFPDFNDSRSQTILGPKPNVVKGTRVILPIHPKTRRLPNDQNRWAICLSQINETIIIVQVWIPAYAPVGIWKCSLQTNIAGQRDKRFDYAVNLLGTTTGTQDTFSVVKDPRWPLRGVQPLELSGRSLHGKWGGAEGVRAQRDREDMVRHF